MHEHGGSHLIRKNVCGGKRAGERGESGTVPTGPITHMGQAWRRAPASARPAFCDPREDYRPSFWSSSAGRFQFVGSSSFRPARLERGMDSQQEEQGGARGTEARRRLLARHASPNGRGPPSATPLQAGTALNKDVKKNKKKPL